MRSYHISEAQFVEASRLAFAPTRRKLMLVVLLLPLPMALLMGDQRPSLLEMGLLYLVLLILMLGVAPALNRWLFRKTYRDNPLLHREQHLELDDEGLVLRSENGESRYRYEQLKKVCVFPDMVLVYPMTTLFHMIPRTLLSEDELDRLRARGGS